ncbi:hypothetical protein M885DRAFT_564046 [Pelagophyceae sp. CCMP2097]|nr:hypothetical protein M885DRAFT_564046 [Pelagophyceae sp. CCMP2097]
MSGRARDPVHGHIFLEYLKMELREALEEDEDDETDDDDDPAPEPPYHGTVIEIEFKKKKDGAYQKGYYVKTARVGDTDATSTGTRIYAINEALTGLILPKDNPRYILRQS